MNSRRRMLTRPVLRPPAAERAVVTDDGAVITLTLYSGADALAVAALDPVEALRVAAKLIDATHRRLAPDLARACAPARNGLSKCDPVADPPTSVEE